VVVAFPPASIVYRFVGGKRLKEIQAWGRALATISEDCALSRRLTLAGRRSTGLRHPAIGVRARAQAAHAARHGGEGGLHATGRRGQDRLRD
jgi:hypothetical protein